MNLYRVGIGSYSDYREEWWTHERKMSQADFSELLLETWSRITKPRLLAAHEAWEREFVDTFGKPRGEVSWYGSAQPETIVGDGKGTYADYVRLDEKEPADEHVELLKDAGFTELTPDAELRTDPSYAFAPRGIGARLDEFEKNLVHELAKLEKRG